VSVDPRTRLWLLLCAGVVAVCLEGVPALLCLALLCGAPLLALRLPGLWWRRGAVVIAALVWGTALSQGLFYADQPRVSLLGVGPVHLYREGVLHGLAQSLRLVAMVLAGLSVAASTPPDRVVAALLALRVPFGLALMGSTALRFVPDVGGEVLSVRAARAARGRPVWRRAPWAWVALEVSLLQPVLARAWRRAHRVAESLDARGFDPLAPRQSWRPLALGPLDAVLGGGALVLAAAVVAARGLWWAYAADAVYVPALRPLYAAVRDWL
jgi:energy-coupling factor transporter transmembrane protein EcfT